MKMFNIHNEPDSISHDKPFKCDICVSSFSNNQGLKIHKKGVHTEIRIDCNLCDGNFKSQQSLKRHIAVIHDKKKGTFNCTLCERLFSAKGNMLRHIKMVHEKQRPFKCELCEAGFCDKNG